jgi:hypothetical protein
MIIDSQLLKEWYCEERARLEKMSSFEGEAKLKLLKIKEIIMDALDKEMNADNLEGKYNDLHLSRLFESHIDKSKTNGILKESISRDKKRVAEELEHTYRKHRARAPDDEKHNVCVQFLYQLEKVKKIGEEIKKRGFEPEQVYRERK